MTTANNNSAAYAYRTDLPTGAFRLMWWQLASSGVVNNTNYSQLFEVAYGAGNYFQLYAPQFDGTPELRYYRAESSADVQILASGSFVGVWIRYLLTWVDGTYTLYRAADGAGTWTSVHSWNNATAPTSICFMAGYLDLGNYLMPGSSIRSARVYTDAHSTTDLLADSLLAVGALSGKWAEWFGGATASLDGSDSSGNSRALTVVGTFIPDTDDPIVSGGSIVTADVAAAGVSAVTAVASVTRTATMAAAGVSAVAFAGSAGKTTGVAVAGVSAVGFTARVRRSANLAIAGASNVAPTARRRVSASLVVTGVAAVTASASRWISAAVTSTGVSAVTFAGRVRRTTTLAISGVTIVTALGRVRRTASLASGGTSAVSFDGTVSTGASVSTTVAGTSAVVFAGRVRRTTTLAIAGTSNVAPTAKRRVSANFSPSGSSLVTVGSRRRRSVNLTTGGVSSVGVVGRRTVSAALATAGVAAVAFAGRVTAGAAAAFSSAGVALVGFTARVRRTGAVTIAGASNVAPTASARYRGAMAAAGAATVSALGRVRTAGSWSAAGASAVTFGARLIAAVYTTVFRVAVSPKRHRITVQRKAYRVTTNDTKWFEAFDPNARDYLEFDLRDVALKKGSNVASVVVIEVDANDNAVGSPVLVFEAPILTTNVAYIMTQVNTGFTDTVVRVRLSYTLADGRRDHFTAFLPVKHQ